MVFLKEFFSWILKKKISLPQKCMINFLARKELMVKFGKVLKN